ncbi:hypothetical protein LCGC14_0635370, partial [marine sediment metagenome]
IQSIDDVSEKLNNALDGKNGEGFDITPEAEFWGHCSNFQVWAEQNYDTRLLHSNLSFPLLKKLTEIGGLLYLRKYNKHKITHRKKALSP